MTFLCGVLNASLNFLLLYRTEAELVKKVAVKITVISGQVITWFNGQVLIIVNDTRKQVSD